MSLLKLCLEAIATPPETLPSIVKRFSEECSESYHLILARPEMARALTELRKDLAKESEFVNVTTVDQELDNINRMSQPQRSYVVAMHKFQPVGLCVSYFSEDTDGFSMMHVGLVAVLNKHAGKGLATSMLKAAEEYGRSLGCYSLHLNVDGDNPHAKRLYEKLGFKEGPKHTYFEMEKRL